VSGETLSTLVLAIVIGVPVIIVVLFLAWLLAWPERLRSQEKKRRREWERSVREHRRKYAEDPLAKVEHEEASGGGDY
jgi:hypothetical protein